MLLTLVRVAVGLDSSPTISFSAQWWVPESDERPVSEVQTKTGQILRIHLSKIGGYQLQTRDKIRGGDSPRYDPALISASTTLIKIFVTLKTLSVGNKSRIFYIFFKCYIYIYICSIIFIEVVEAEIDVNFLKNVMVKIDYAVLYEAAKSVGEDENLPSPNAIVDIDSLNEQQLKQVSLPFLENFFLEDRVCESGCPE